MPETVKFQSTPSGGKATGSATRQTLLIFQFQSTPSGGKATHVHHPVPRRFSVSIHAFRGEGDRLGKEIVLRSYGFNPRLPGGRRLSLNADIRSRRIVSIHAFRGEGDAAASASPRAAPSFNPRLPGGRRPIPGAALTVMPPFQSTPSGGKATKCVRRDYASELVSIHAFRGEGDVRVNYFDVHDLDVSIHAFRGEGDPG